MKPRSEIVGNSRLRKLPGFAGVERAELNLKSGQFLVAFAADEEGWEHVSVSPKGSKRESLQPCPTWEQMCDVKRFFWPDDEMVVQLHPPESVYLHGITFDTNILHLWRPVDGDWTKLAGKDQRATAMVEE